MSSTRARRSGGRQFAVGGRWRHVAVVDTGCGCRPRRPRLPLMSLPSFLRPSVTRSGSSSRSSSLFPSSASTASSASAATYSSYSSSGNYANYPASAHVYKHHQEPAVPYGVTAKASAPVARNKVGSKAKKRREKMAAAAEVEEEEDVGVAVEKESSDPRADFRDSMVQMVVEMGLCDWDGLRCMLRRLLALNAPRHHAAILAAFAEVCAQLASEPRPPPPPAYQYDYYY
ncbi:hypothetical protein CFC21_070780 [Triticum aestivum]|uniref:Transcription repressor n=3 Tax=Triticum TaxID=4564 RepID=A0A9R1AIZ4_TRITD|nr:transcription repressor OFP8-like [Triticum dicoccoides]XP_044392892.1 transcription repressor OFP8-like isoform X2 [Triticum aestivum]KAF7064482.1 hypothetical protein CFC21_070780 [Triticum aestivum]VAI29651.1 unnamed protein product [Triticum turgidum subsp. durum]